MDPFDVDRFLARPLVARIAADGPTVRSVWYVWESGAFWWITGPYAARLSEAMARNPRLALVVDTCDLRTGKVLKITVEGHAERRPFDRELVRRLLIRYLGSDEDAWDARFRTTLTGETGEVLIRLVPESFKARDLSFSVEPDRA